MIARAAAAATVAAAGRGAPAATREVPAWLDRAEYPFTSRWLETPHGVMHYVDEGAGEVVLFVHGNPTWSFEHRRLIRHLSAGARPGGSRPGYRCVAIDHLGFGLSDKPAGVSYLPQFHAANLARVVEALGLRDVTLVVHDWGGPIGLSYALDHPANVRRIVAYNSWWWSVRGDPTFERFSAFVGGPVGRILCKYLNFFPRVLLPASVGDRRRLSRAVRQHFTAPFPTPRSRTGTYVFPRAILGESAWLDALWGRRDAVRDIPLLLLWGLKDVAFTTALLARWEAAFADHVTHTFADVGHFAPEELGNEAIGLVEAFLECHPVP